jgi:hypothetical protein
VKPGRRERVAEEVRLFEDGGLVSVLAPDVVATSIARVPRLELPTSEVGVNLDRERMRRVDGGPVASEGHAEPDTAARVRAKVVPAAQVEQAVLLDDAPEQSHIPRARE